MVYCFKRDNCISRPNDQSTNLSECVLDLNIPVVPLVDNFSSALLDDVTEVTSASSNVAFEWIDVTGGVNVEQDGCLREDVVDVHAWGKDYWLAVSSTPTIVHDQRNVL